MNVRFACPDCGAPGRLTIPGQTSWQCPACEHRLEPTVATEAAPTAVCAICANRELYKKKNFPHALGMTILTIACIASFVTYLSYEKVWTWVILGGTAIFDIALYLWVGDVAVCYRCGAVHGGVAVAQHQPFDLGISERYRQEQIRRSQLQAEKRQPF
jgi:hypothetical protein